MGRPPYTLVFLFPCECTALLLPDDLTAGSNELTMRERDRRPSRKQKCVEINDAQPNGYLDSTLSLSPETSQEEWSRKHGATLRWTTCGNDFIRMEEHSRAAREGLMLLDAHGGEAIYRENEVKDIFTSHAHTSAGSALWCTTTIYAVCIYINTLKDHLSRKSSNTAHGERGRRDGLFLDGGGRRRRRYNPFIFKVILLYTRVFEGLALVLLTGIHYIPAERLTARPARHRVHTQNNKSFLILWLFVTIITESPRVRRVLPIDY